MNTFKLTKSQVIEILGLNKETGRITASEAAKKMRISKGWLSEWPESLDGIENFRKQDIVLSAIFRFNLRRRYNQTINYSTSS